MQYNIFIVEDDKSIRDMYEMAFSQEEFNISTFVMAETMFDCLNKYSADLIILDLMLPGMDGLSALKKIKEDKNTQDIPVIIVSAKGDEAIKVKGLDMGADDYIEKPFGMFELVARVKANLRKVGGKGENKIIAYNDIVINDDEHIVTVGGQQVNLTLKEYKLLQLLMQNIDKVVDRETILRKVWDYEYFGETRTLDMHIKSLRSKLEEFTPIKYIATVRGVGYKFCKVNYEK
ncbi:MAG: response regulator transcription factor [Christensenellales bacterium]